MLDHVSLPVADLARAAAFYDRVLQPLGARRVMEFPEAIGYGAEFPHFWIGRPEATPAMPGSGLHLAFRAETAAAVDAFHAAGLGAGATDAGAPGLRPHYHPNYYGAFLIDPDGFKIEAVCHHP